MATIEISNVSFTYRVLKNRSGSLKELFKDFVSRKVRVENYQALKDVSFTVNSGEVLAQESLVEWICLHHFCR